MKTWHALVVFFLSRIQHLAVALAESKTDIHIHIPSIAPSHLAAQSVSIQLDCSKA